MRLPESGRRFRLTQSAMFRSAVLDASLLVFLSRCRVRNNNGGGGGGDTGCIMPVPKLRPGPACLPARCGRRLRQSLPPCCLSPASRCAWPRHQGPAGGGGVQAVSQGPGSEGHSLARPRANPPPRTHPHFDSTHDGCASCHSGQGMDGWAGAPFRPPTSPWPCPRAEGEIKGRGAPCQPATRAVAGSHMARRSLDSARRG